VHSKFILDEYQINEAFINEGRGHSPSHLKFFLLVFSKLKKRHKIKMRPKPKAQAKAQEGQSPKSPSPSHEGQGQVLNYSCIVVGGVDIK